MINKFRLNRKYIGTVLLTVPIIIFLFQGCTSSSWPIPGTFIAVSAAITSPAHGSRHSEGAIISFTGTGYGINKSKLGGTALVWTSDKDGQIGTGMTFDITSLSENTHVITLTATDSNGDTATASITIKVGVAWLPAPQLNFRQIITMDSSITPSDRTNFPVLVQITDQNNPIFGNSQPDGDDIVFTESDGVTKLDHEIDHYKDTTTRELDAWVRIPNLSSTVDTVLYMYYGNNSISSQENENAVWDSNYVMVHHLQESPADGVTGHIDSTQYGNDGTPMNFEDNTGTTNAIGKIGGADSFAGDNDYVTVSDSNSLDITNELTFEIWVKNAGGPINQIVIDKRDVVRNPPGWWRFSMWNGQTSFQVSRDVWMSTSWTTSIGDNTWHHVAGVMNGRLQLYVDGVIRRNVNNWIGNMTTNDAPLFIGKYITDVAFYIGGIDEIRISNTARSADWIAASFNNQNNPTGYLIFNTEEIF